MLFDHTSVDKFPATKNKSRLKPEFQATTTILIAINQKAFSAFFCNTSRYSLGVTPTVALNIRENAL